MLKTLRQIASIGIVSEPAPQADESLRIRNGLQDHIRAVLGRALCIRHIDAGSCNGCELEIHALNNPLYNLEGLGIRFVASPRHADMLLVTGPVSKHMEVALRRTYEATPDPKLVIALGDCGCTGGIFGENYASRGRVVGITSEGGAEHIELLAQKYTGGPYQWYGGRDQIRVILTITADKIHSMDR